MKQTCRMTMRSRIVAIPVVVASIGLAGCSTTSGRTFLTGSAGTAVSSAAYISALEGGLVSRSKGVSLSAADRQRALEAEYRALEAAPGGQPVVWQGRGVQGSVVAAAPYQVGSQNCRQYSHTLVANGRETVSRGAACRTAAGTWTPLS
jgi:surface antigen